MRIEDAARPAPRVFSFPAFSTAHAHTLILGTMPGEASLRAGRFYAHPQNQFWRILGEILGFAPESDHAVRVDALNTSGIALWDVLRSCVRPGSLDSDIVAGSQEANDFATFFAAHRGIERVLFNGAKAEACFRKQVMPLIDVNALQLIRLPSTSPANASMPLARKLAQWRMALGFLFPSGEGARQSLPRP